jgi:hypothetical protein
MIHGLDLGIARRTRHDRPPFKICQIIEPVAFRHFDFNQSLQPFLSDFQGKFRLETGRLWNFRPLLIDINIKQYLAAILFQ